ncbi:hypothetical protein DIPPA_63029 [Diplonema papillatum]|nr:hypothetical protein DIPPA_63029 [Diplonema papillatum]KAJ9443061.1 hypothetical protein DIPPA_63029 [Diplonema papillatum]
MASINQDFTIDVNAEPKKAEAKHVLNSSMQSTVVRRVHDWLHDGTRVLDQGNRVRTITRDGNMKTSFVVSEDSDVSICDISSIKGRSDLFAILAAGSGNEGGAFVIHTVDDEGSEAKLCIELPSGVQGTKVEGYLKNKVPTYLLLLSDNQVYEMSIGDVEALRKPDTSLVKMSLSDATDKKLAKKVLTGKKAMSLSTDGTAIVCICSDSRIETIATATLKTLCHWYPDEQSITSIRMFPAFVGKDKVVSSHNVLVWSSSSGTLSVYHVKATSGKWVPWKRQTVTIKGLSGSPCFEIGSNSDCAVLSSQSLPTFVALRISAASEEQGCFIRGAQHFSCDPEGGAIVSVVLRSEKEGVRISARRINSVVIFDLAFSSFSSLPKEHLERASKTIDLLEATVKKLTAENASLKAENEALRTRKTAEMPQAVQQQLTVTTELVDETCRMIMKSQIELTERLLKLESEMKCQQDLHASHTQRTEEQLATTNRQVLSLLKESAMKDTDMIKELQVAASAGLKKAREESLKEYEKLTEEASRWRVTEQKQLTEGLRKCLQSILSEPGLLRLKDMVAKNDFRNSNTDDDEAAIKKGLEDMQVEVQKNLESVVRVFLEQERVSLQKATDALLSKADGLVTRLPAEVSNEMKNGVNEFEHDRAVGGVGQRWQQEADARLQSVVNEAESRISKISKAPVEQSVMLALKKRHIDSSISRDLFWKEGIAELITTDDTSKKLLLAHVFDNHPHPPPVSNRDDNHQLLAEFALLVSQFALQGRTVATALLYLEVALQAVGIPATQRVETLVRGARENLSLNRNACQGFTAYQRIEHMYR